MLRKITQKQRETHENIIYDKKQNIYLFLLKAKTKFLNLQILRNSPSNVYFKTIEISHCSQI